MSTKAIEALRALQEIGALEPGLIGIGPEIDAAVKLAREALAALEAEQAQGEAVGEVVEMEDGCRIAVWRDGTPEPGTKLYTHPSPSDARDAGWQPIETAPADEEVLLFSKANQRWFIGRWADYHRYNSPQITHWAPRPAAPQEADRD